tara:strand:- start:1991 stop:2206 length:216 start_codon:yes stop_codon:yes gene_type:complete
MGTNFNILCYPYYYTFNCITLRSKNGFNCKTKKVAKSFADGNLKKSEKKQEKKEGEIICRIILEKVLIQKG